jgi:TRAP-type transport system periplasmic protein
MSRTLRRRLLQSALIVVATAAMPAFAQDPIPIRVANPAADEDPIGIAAARFAARVQELAGDAVQVRVFSRSVLGNENAALEGTMAGNIDVDIVSNSVLRGVVPELSVLDVPYGLSSPEHAWRVLDGEIGQELAASVQEKGLRLAGWAYAGSRCLMTKEKPVHTPDDMSGMKLRVPNNPTYAAIAEAWGTIPTTVGWPETYLALSQGVVDGIETAPGPSFDQKHFEVAKNLVRTDHLIYFHIWVISEKSWSSWPENVQNAVFTAAQEAALYNRELRLEQEKGVYDEFAAMGVTVIEPDRAQFAARLKDIQAVDSVYLPMLERIRATAN